MPTPEVIAQQQQAQAAAKGGMGRPAIKARKMTNLHSRQSRTTYQFTQLQ